jgi:type IV pilus assembly protein PilX
MTPVLVQPQRGSALIVSLIFLVILTLLGITAASVTSQEERMAGNTRDRDLAFEAAEAAMRDAELRLPNATFRGLATTLNVTDANDAAYWNAYNWGTSISPSQTLNQIVQQPQIVLQRRGATNYYRITTRGFGGTANAVVILQAEYLYTP